MKTIRTCKVKNKQYDLKLEQMIKKKYKSNLPFLIVAGLLFSLVSCGDEKIASESSVEKNYPVVMGNSLNIAVKGMMRIKFKRESETYRLLETQRNTPAIDLAAMDEVTRGLQNVKVRPLFNCGKKYQRAYEKHGLDLWYEVTFDESEDLGMTLAGYARNSDIEIIQPVYEMTMYDDGPIIPVSLDQMRQSKAAMPFNDPALSKQWHYDAGDLWTEPDANIGLFNAWKVTAGSPEVIVAILDQGVDITHEDLVDNLWTNPGEIPDNGIDDDGNGVIDDIHGYNFAKKTSTIDKGDHGTHVAGTVSAVNNNGIGVCGVAGGTGKKDGVKIMSCQITNVTGNFSGQPDAFRYATEMGAVICQCSWGFPKPGQQDAAINAAIDFFVEFAGCDLEKVGDGEERVQTGPMKGGVAIFAYGNSPEGQYGDFYPAAYRNCIGVAATDYCNKKAIYSNYGKGVSLSAPGGDVTQGSKKGQYGILSTIPEKNGEKYGHKEGTSMACPHVSGIAALVVSDQKGPGFTREKLTEILLNATIDLHEAEPNYAGYMGKGLLRADLALRANDHTPPVVIPDLKLLKENGKLVLSWKVPSDLNDGTPVSFHIYYSNKPLTAANYKEAEVKTIEVKDLKAGEEYRMILDWLAADVTWSVVLTSTDRWGNESEISNEVSNLLIGKDQLKVYPNPVRKEMNLLWGTDFKGNKEVRIYDMSGRQVFGKTFSTIGAGNEKIDLSILSAGKYVLKFESGNLNKSVNIVKIR